MDNPAVLSSTLVLAGAVFMAAAIIRGRQIRATVPAQLRRKWHTMIAFMVVFLAGYLMFAAVLLGNLKLPQEKVTSPIFLGGAIFVFIVISLTRRTIAMMQRADEVLVAAQEELQRREKLVLLGIVAGRVGNELRNPLGVMSNAVFFLESRLTGADASVSEYLGIIRKEIDGSQQILSDFIDYFRASPPRAKPVRVEELVNRSLAGCAVPENVTVRVELPETLPAVRVDPSQLRQVLRNLIHNAVQAMPEGGTLRIGARFREEAGGAPGAPGAPLSRGRTGEPRKEGSDLLEVSVADSGVGISPEHLEKVFQPLFTTKSRGLGLGLSICKGFVEANGGRIEVRSALGEGSCFSLRLPVDAGLP